MLSTYSQYCPGAFPSWILLLCLLPPRLGVNATTCLQAPCRQLLFNYHWTLTSDISFYTKTLLARIQNNLLTGHSHGHLHVMLLASLSCPCGCVRPLLLMPVTLQQPLPSRCPPHFSSLTGAPHRLFLWIPPQVFATTSVPLCVACDLCGF